MKQMLFALVLVFIGEPLSSQDVKNLKVLSFKTKDFFFRAPWIVIIGFNVL